MVAGHLRRKAIATGVVAVLATLSIAAPTADARSGVKRAAACGGGWPSYGGDLANSRSQHHPGKLGAGSVKRLRRNWAIRGNGLSAGNPPSVTGTPAVAGCIAYYGDWRGSVRAVSLRNGDRLWRTQIDAASFPYTPVNSSPAVSGDAVYASTGHGHVTALARATGKVRWSTLLDSRNGTLLYASPVVSGRTLVVGVSSIQNAIQASGYDFQGSIVALDTLTGKVRWRTPVMRPGVDGPGGSVWSSAAIDRGRGIAYVGTGQAYTEPSGPRNDALLALRLSDGHVVWSRQFTTNDVYTFFGSDCCDYDIGASPNLFRIKGRAVVGVGDKAGRYAVLDRGSGRTVWRRKLCPGSHLGGVMTTAAVARGTIWVACNRFAPEALTPFPDLDNPRNRTDVIALKTSTGARRWSRRVQGVTLGALTEAGGAVFVPNTRGILRAWSGDRGRLLWTRKPGGPLGGGVTVAGGLVLAGYGDFAGPAQPQDSTGGVIAYAVRRP